MAYFEDITRARGGAEDYFSGKGDERGRWVGSSLPSVGLTAGTDVDPEAAHRLLFAAQHPDTGESLGQQVRTDGVVGFGMTFSAPKSVSLLWALGSPEVVTWGVSPSRAAPVPPHRSGVSPREP